ncbi:MAG: T9SS type A sorting domain-containing protein [Bacteroidetes bacterium]|nr:T9SS type A sorting domain-containing protein [Bacteroidota bacterium]
MVEHSRHTYRESRALSRLFMMSLVAGWMLYMSGGNAAGQWTTLNSPHEIERPAFFLDSTSVLASTYSRGLFLSEDKGFSWKALRGSDGGDHFTLLAVDGVRIFARQRSTEVHENLALSTDRGATWMAIALAPWDPTCLVRCRDSLFLASRHGLYRSSDDGQSWSRIVTGLPDTSVASLVTAGGELFLGADGEAYVSRSASNRWEQITLSVPDIVSLYAFGTDLFANTVDVGLFRSTDLGRTWRSVAGALNEPRIRDMGESGDILIVASYRNGLFRSTDRGATWDSCNQGLNTREIHGIVAHGPTVVAWGNGLNHYVSTDHGSCWVLGSATSLANDGLFAYGRFLYRTASNDFGVLRSSDSGRTWTECGPSDQNGMVKRTALFHIDSLLYNIPFFGGGVFTSADSGDSWKRIGNGPTQVVGLVKTEGETLIAATTSGVFKSTDGGASWILSSEGLTFRFLTSLVLCNGFLFAGTEGGGVFRADIGASSWSACSDGLANLYVQSMIAIDTCLMAAITGRPGIHISSDLGQSWKPAYSGLPGALFRMLVNAGRSVFTASDLLDGIFQSTDLGTSWLPVNDGLPRERVLRMTLSSTDLLAILNGAGLWSRPLSQLVTGVPPVTHVTPACVSLSQNYPNPFNPVTTIQYVLPARSTVLLSVYNLLGQQVAVLEDGDREAGVHEVAFDAGRLASGVYFYRIIAGPFAATRKLLVVR